MVSSVFIAQVWEYPALTLLAWVSPVFVTTGTGVVLEDAVESPSFPEVLCPQHQRVSSVLTAQVWPKPALRLLVWVSPVFVATRTGVVLWAVVASPSCP